MTTKYCDHGAYGAYAATPTWGVPQEGDGAAKAASTTAATLSLDMTTWVFNNTTSTVSVMGATALTVTAGANSATNIQYSATLTTMIDNIVTVINTLATAAIANKPTGWATPQIRNAVFARRTGNSLDLMTRTGSADWNTLTGIAFANVTNATSGTWSGGVSGCWGYLFNTATVWASAVAIFTYGVWSTTLPNAGIIAAGDVVKIRSGKTVSLTSNLINTLVLPNIGTTAAPVIYQIDDSTEWADGANPVFKYSQTTTSNGYGITFGPATTFTGCAYVKGSVYSDGTRSLQFEVVNTSAQTGAVNAVLFGSVTYEGVLFSAPGTRAQSAITSSTVGATTSMTGNQITRFLGCKFKWPGQQSTVITMGNGGYNWRAEFISCDFEATDASVAATSVILLHNNNTHRLYLDSCTFTGFVTQSRLIASASAPTGDDCLMASNCDFGNVNILGPNTLGAAVGEFDAGLRGVFITSQYNNHDFVFERAGRLYVEWLYSKGRPTLNAKLHDGTTSWSIFAVPSSTASAVGSITPASLPRIGKVIPANADLTEGVRTLTLNFLLESNLTWTKNEISMRVDYTTPTGVAKTISSHDIFGSALSSSSAAWSATSWNSQTWVKKEIALTTPSSVKAGSEVAVYVQIHTTSSNETWGVIVDPEVLVT